MEINQLKSLFPDAKVEMLPVENAEYLNFPMGNKWLTIPAVGMSTREVAILKLLANEQNSTQTLLANQHRWFRRLFLDEALPKGYKEKIRVIQIQIINHDPAIAPTKWLAAFQSMFEIPLLDAFMISHHGAIAVEKYSQSVLSSDEFLGIIQTLDNDFSCTSKVYVGQYWLVNEKSSAPFSQERELFQFQIQQNTNHRVFTVSDSILKYCFEKQLSQNELIVQSKKKLSLMPNSRETIFILYHNAGNISRAAKLLYIHRNTLQYRLRKFQGATGFDLKNMNDLLFCYLLTIR